MVESKKLLITLKKQEFRNKARMIRHFSEDWIREWCNENGWTDLFLNRRDYWAFPPNAVMPLPIPKETLLQIKAEKGFCHEEKIWVAIALLITMVAGISTYIFSCPMPLVGAFALCALVVGNFDLD